MYLQRGSGFLDHEKLSLRGVLCQLTIVLTNHHNIHTKKKKFQPFIINESVGQLDISANLGWAWLGLSVLMHQMPAATSAGEGLV